MTPNKANIDLAIFTPTMSGGVGGVLFNLINGLQQKKYTQELIITLGSNTDYLNKNINTIIFNCPRTFKTLPKLIKYLKEKRPKVLLSAIYHANIVASLAIIIANTDTKLILTEHIALQPELDDKPWLQRMILKFLIRVFFKRADKIIAVSQGVADDLKNYVNEKKIRVIYNPVISDRIYKLANEPIDHLWFSDKNCPVIVGAGRLVAQKDFSTLIKAFAIVRDKINCKLIILGDGPQKNMLNNLINKYNLQNDAEIDFKNNPYPYFAQGDLFVLSSAWEGFGNVIVEAMALGLPVVSTDCPSGPREILENGKLGILVPVKDIHAMAHAILKAIHHPPEKIDLKNLNRFTAVEAVKNYEGVIFSI